jgi:anti-sigma B factor antagonist
LDIQVQTLGGATLLIPAGRLDFGAAPALEKDLEKAFAVTAKGSRLIVDCGALEYVSSAGLRVFLLGARSGQRRGVSFALCSLMPAVREVFDLSGFSRIIPVFPDRAAALDPPPQAPV